MRARVALAGVGVPAAKPKSSKFASNFGGKFKLRPGAVERGALPGGLEDLHVHWVELGAAQPDALRRGQRVSPRSVVRVQRPAAITWQ